MITFASSLIYLVIWKYWHSIRFGRLMPIRLNMSLFRPSWCFWHPTARTIPMLPRWCAVWPFFTKIQNLFYENFAAKLRKTLKTKKVFWFFPILINQQPDADSHAKWMMKSGIWLKRWIFGFKFEYRRNRTCSSHGFACFGVEMIDARSNHNAEPVVQFPD